MGASVPQADAERDSNRWPSRGGGLLVPDGAIVTATNVVAWAADAALYCDDCARKRYGDIDGGAPDGEGNEVHPVFSSEDEADCPQHCDDCGAFLENALTGDGWAYVLEAVIEDLAAGRLGSVALTEWAPYYGFPDTLEPGRYLDRAETVQGSYWACADYHGGQSSAGYRHLSKLGRYYLPGRLEKTASLEGDALAAYVRVAVHLLKVQS
jgi:hypothetical protein